MARFSIPVGVLLLVSMVGCGHNRYFEKVSPETETSAEVYFDLLRQHLFEQFESVLDPSVRNPDLRSRLSAMAALIPDRNPQSAKVKWSHVSCNALTCDTSLLLEYRYPNERLVVNELIRTEANAASLLRFEIRPIPESEMEANSFTLSNKGISQYTALALAISLPLFSLYALVLCIQTKGLKSKWLWVGFILIGFGRVGVLWTNGLWSYNIFYVQLLSAGFFNQFYGPVVIYFSLPLGAIAFMRYRKNLNNHATPDVSPNAPGHPTADLFKSVKDETGA
jgi:hypothetical protein